MEDNATTTQPAKAPIPAHIVAMNETTQAVKDLHRWMRTVLIVWVVLSAIGGVWAYAAMNNATSGTTTYCVSTSDTTCP